MIRYVLMLLLLGFAAVYAFRRGGGPERLVAATLVAWAAASKLQIWWNGGATNSGVVDLYRFTFDVAAAILFVVLALRANRLWTMALASTQLLSVLAHFTRLLDSTIPWLVTAIFERAPFWLEIILLIAGTYGRQRRDRRAIARCITSPA